MAKRTISKAAEPPEVPRTPGPETAWVAARHSGEGAASALETLQKIEERRDAGRPTEPAAEKPGE